MEIQICIVKTHTQLVCITMSVCGDSNLKYSCFYWHFNSVFAKYCQRQRVLTKMRVRFQTSLLFSSKRRNTQSKNFLISWRPHVYPIYAELKWQQWLKLKLVLDKKIKLSAYSIVKNDNHFTCIWHTNNRCNETSAPGIKA